MTNFTEHTLETAIIQMLATKGYPHSRGDMLKSVLENWKLERLQILHQDMRRQGCKTARFGFTKNQVNFDVSFVTAVEPYVLLFAVRGGQFSMKLLVTRGYQVDTKLPREGLLQVVRCSGA